MCHGWTSYEAENMEALRRENMEVVHVVSVGFALLFRKSFARRWFVCVSDCILARFTGTVLRRCVFTCYLLYVFFSVTCIDPFFILHVSHSSTSLSFSSSSSFFLVLDILKSLIFFKAHTENPSLKERTYCHYRRALRRFKDSITLQ